jgi:hypothetical protein
MVHLPTFASWPVQAPQLFLFNQHCLKKKLLLLLLLLMMMMMVMMMMVVIMPRAAKWKGRTVAVKVLSHEGSRESKLNALHEAAVSAHMHHPNVVSNHLSDSSV